MVDKNLFLYDLAVVAIFKDEGHYLKEWIDYHLLAGVEHFYLYNNESSDNYKEVLAPYVEENLVTLTDFPGKLMQADAYDDAIENYRFECRYMAFIDLDEFIFPKTNQKISEVLDENLLRFTNAGGLAINWQIFGSNGQEKADYSRGVLERFTRRASSNRFFFDTNGKRSGNTHIKTIANPRFVWHSNGAHYVSYFNNTFSVNSNGDIVLGRYNAPVLDDKIVVNHYVIKSREEFFSKKNKGRADGNDNLHEQFFSTNDTNEVFDDGILKYRAAREKVFSFESDNQRANRVVKSLAEILTQSLPDDDPSNYSLADILAQNSPEDRLANFFVGKLETFLTCRAVAEKFQIKFGDHFAEEIALNLIYRTLIQAGSLTYAEIQMFLKALPEILSRPFPICRELKDLAQSNVIPRFCEALKNDTDNLSNGEETMRTRNDSFYVQKLLRLIK